MYVTTSIAYRWFSISPAVHGVVLMLVAVCMALQKVEIWTFLCMSLCAVDVCAVLHFATYPAWWENMFWHHAIVLPSEKRRVRDALQIAIDKVIESEEDTYANVSPLLLHHVREVAREMNIDRCVTVAGTKVRVSRARHSVF